MVENVCPNWKRELFFYCSLMSRQDSPDGNCSPRSQITLNEEVRRSPAPTAAPTSMLSICFGSDCDMKNCNWTLSMNTRERDCFQVGGCSVVGGVGGGDGWFSSLYNARRKLILYFS